MKDSSRINQTEEGSAEASIVRSVIRNDDRGSFFGSQVNGLRTSTNVVDRFRRSSTKNNMKKTTVTTKNLRDTKDELEFATNWRRVFMDLYQQLKWLNAYAVINELALEKILKKFMKEHFVMKDNVINKDIARYVREREFSRRQKLKHVRDDLFTFFTEAFTDSNKNKSKRMLDHLNTEMRRKDALCISFFAGMSLTMICIGLFFLFTPPSDGHQDFDELISALPAIRLSFVCVYVLFATGFVIQVF